MPAAPREGQGERGGCSIMPADQSLSEGGAGGREAAASCHGLKGRGRGAVQVKSRLLRLWEQGEERVAPGERGRLGIVPTAREARDQRK